MSPLNFGTRGLIDLFMNHSVFVKTSLIILSEPIIQTVCGSMNEAIV
jgi:hypothetical protein